MSSRTPDIPEELVARARGGDEAALRALIESVYPVVHRWSLVHTGDATEADDLTQDVLVQMLRRLQSFRGDASFPTWLYVVTRNAAVDRARQTRRRTELAERGAVHLRLVADPSEDPSRAVERAEAAALLARFLNELPPRQRQAFDLVELQGLTSVEASEWLAIDPVSVRAHLHKARRRIRALILEAHPELVEDAP